MRKRFIGRLLSEPFTLAAIIYLISLALLALLADFIAPYDAMEQSLAFQLNPVRQQALWV